MLVVYINQEQSHKHYHPGGGAARPSSGVDLMNPRRWRGGWPWVYFSEVAVNAC
jgi:hypothetical protein